MSAPTVCIACAWMGDDPDNGRCPLCHRTDSLRRRRSHDELLARDLVTANFWTDRGIGIAQRAILAYALGIESGNTGTPPMSPIEALRAVANLLEMLKSTHPDAIGPDTSGPDASGQDTSGTTDARRELRVSPRNDDRAEETC